MDISTLAKKLDFRFASADDATELAEFLNSASEQERTGPQAFKSPDGVILPSEIERDCSSMGVQWVVLETPVPFEDIVAASKLRLSSEGATVEYIVAIRDAQGTPFDLLLRNQLLRKLENVARAHGFPIVSVYSYLCQEAQGEWLVSCGYEEAGGFLSEDPKLMTPTMVIVYKKSIQLIDNMSDTKSSSSCAGAEGEDMAVLPDETAIVDLGFEIVDDSIDTAAIRSDSSSMEGLIKDLFKALHNEL